MEIELICPICNKNFNRSLNEHNRSLKRNRKEYCCRHCAGIDLNKNFGNKRHIFTKAENLYYNKRRYKDINASFRKFMCSIRNRDHEYDISVDDLKNQWNKQNGICPYTGIKMLLPKSTAETIKSLIAASVDRIDSSKGYTRENIEFVCRFINLAKNSFSKKDVLDFIKQIKIININSDFEI